MGVIIIRYNKHLMIFLELNMFMYIKCRFTEDNASK